MPRTIRRSVPNVLRIPKTFASLRRIYGERYFLYEVRFEADQIEAIQKDALQVRLSFYHKRPFRQESLFQKNLARSNKLKTKQKLAKSRRIAREVGRKRRRMRKPKPVNLVRALLQRSSIRKDARRGRKDLAFQKHIVDMTKFFSNRSAARIRRLSRKKAIRLLPVQKKLTLVSVKEIKKSGRRLPVLQINRPRRRIPRNVRSRLQKIAFGVVLRTGLDPASVYKDRRTIVSAQRAVGGMSLRKRSRRPPRRSSRFERALLAYRPMSKAQRNVLKMTSTTLIPVFQRVRDPFVKVRSRFLIQQDKLENAARFYIKMDLYDVRSKKTIFSTTRSVNHSAQVAALRTPRRPPRISVTPYRKIGKNTMSLRQRDRIADKIHVYRKVISSIRASDAKFELAATVKLNRGDGQKRFVDFVDNSKTIIYRAIPVGPGGEVGIGFGSAVAAGIPQKASKKQKKITSAPVVSRVRGMGIELVVTSIPPSVVALTIMRRDLTIHQKAFTLINDKNPLRQVNEDDVNVSFMSTDVKSGHVYEFRPKLIYDDADEEMSGDVSIVKYLPLRVNVVDTTLGDPTIREVQPGRYDARFSIASAIIPGEQDILKQALEDQGMASLFSDVMLEDRDALQKIVTHGITRTNLKTGREDHLGTFVSGEFSDRKASILNGAELLEAGATYRYEIRPQLRSPSSLFGKLKIEATDPVSSRTYKYSPQKFRNPITLETGTIMTTASRKTRHAENQFEMGDVGSPSMLRVQIPDPPPEIRSVIARQLDRDTVQVFWKMTGDPERIDHFIIEATKLNQIELMGSVHNVPISEYFTFYDEHIEDDQQIMYTVTAVLTNYVQLPPVDSNRIVT